MIKLVRSVHQGIHGFLDQHLGTGIDRAGGLIQDEDLRVGEDGAGNGQQLLLPLRDIAGLLIQHHVVAFRQGADEVVHIGSLGSPDIHLRRWRPDCRSGCSP